MLIAQHDASAQLRRGVRHPVPAPRIGVEVFAIQGTGDVSPYVGQRVRTTPNIVTLSSAAGFFMQTPDRYADDDEATSNGIYVHTGSAQPAALEGDEVIVEGTVREHFGMTQILDPTVTVVRRYGPLPRPRAPLPPFEPLEGMFVAVDDALVVEPTDRFNEFKAVATRERTFREPGRDWDRNPEIFEVDTENFDAGSFQLTAGSTFSATGAMGYAFGSYQLWVGEIASVDLAPSGRPVRARAGGEITVASQNLRRYENPSKLALHITELMRLPDILAVQEVLTVAELQDLASRLPGGYRPHLIEGNDPVGIDVGYLVREGIDVHSVTQFGASLTHAGGPLYDRPPLILETPQLTVINVHLRSLINIETEDRVRSKRYQQALELAKYIDGLQSSDPSRRILVLGDFNAFEFSDGYVEVVGMISGVCDEIPEERPCVDVVARDLRNLVLTMRREERYSFVYEGSSQALDHALVSKTLLPMVRDAVFTRGNADSPDAWKNDSGIPHRASDHDGIVVFLETGG